MYNMLPALSKYLEVLCVVLLLINCFKLNSCVDAVQNSKPNIVLIIADDAGWNDFSFHGSAQIPTPNIDALAFSGVILNSYYAAPLCTPSRGATLTGKHPIHLGLQHHVIIGDTADGLPLSEKLLPEYLKEIGYSTHLIGKWHVGHATKAFTPTFRGFDTHYGFWLGEQDYYDHTNADDFYRGYDFRQNMEVHRQPIGLYNTDLITNETVRIIEEHRGDKPMFLMVAHSAPHTGNYDDPLQAPQENIDKFKDTIADEKRRVYAAMVDKLDESVGLIISSLGKKGLLNNSIIVFAADNGAASEGHGGSYGSNWPLRSIKNTIWEGGMRVAACVWSPLVERRVSADLMYVSDWLPTLYEAAGGDVKDVGRIDGVSMWNTLTKGGASPRQEVLYNIDNIYNHSAVRFGPWKLIQGNTSRWFDYGFPDVDGWYGYYDHGTLVKDLIPEIVRSKVAQAFDAIGHKLESATVEMLQKQSLLECNKTLGDIPCDPYTGPCLFNVEQDPCEKHNLADKEHLPILARGLDLIKMYNGTARDLIDLSPHPEAAPDNWGGVWTNWLDFIKE